MTEGPIAWFRWTSRWWRYGIAVALTGLTMALRGSFSAAFDGPTMIVFVVPIVLSAHWGGAGPGLFATFLTALGASYYVLSPLHSFSIASFDAQLQESLLLITGVLISGISWQLHQARSRAETVIVALEVVQRDLRAASKSAGELRLALDEHAIVAVTDPRGTITFVNDKFCDISGYSREQLVGLDHRVISSGFHPASFITSIWTTIAQGNVWHDEIKNRAKDGSFYWVDTTIVPLLNDAGQPAQYISIGADVTERKRAEKIVQELNASLEERVLERTAEVEASNKELEAFSYSVSHDLRAPLRAMNGFAEMALEEFGPGIPPEAARYLKRIQSGGKQMGQLIDDLLAFSRLSRQPVKRNVVKMNLLVREVLADLEVQHKGRDIVLRVAELPNSEGDVTLVKQVWMNLVSNAMKYSRLKSSALIEIGFDVEHGEDVYWVRDNGSGFDMQYAHKLFGVFQRLHRADEFEGTGVGLAIVQRVIHRHGGRVWAYAEVGRGATFRFTLPKGATV